MLLKKTHMPIVLSIVEGCARLTRFDVLKCTPLEFVFVVRVRVRSEFPTTFSRTRSRGFRLVSESFSAACN
jgi:hypothetical protein